MATRYQLVEKASLTAATATRSGRAQSIIERNQIHTRRRRPISILPTPSIPGRNRSDPASSLASTRNTIRPSWATATGVVRITVNGNGWSGSAAHDQIAVLAGVRTSSTWLSGTASSTW